MLVHGECIAPDTGDFSNYLRFETTTDTYEKQKDCPNCGTVDADFGVKQIKGLTKEMQQVSYVIDFALPKDDDDQTIFYDEWMKMNNKKPNEHFKYDIFHRNRGKLTKKSGA